jgi:hypothetical protein
MCRGSLLELRPLADAHGVFLDAAWNGNAGCLDFQDCNLYHSYGISPVDNARKCVKIFELDVHTVRLKEE